MDNTRDWIGNLLTGPSQPSIIHDFKKRETLNNTYASSTLNTRKKIVKHRNNYNDYNTKCCEKNKTN